MSLFDPAPAAGPPTPDEVLDQQAARKAAERARNASRRGTRTSHPCPCCDRRTFRRIRRYPTLGYVDARCSPCVDRNVWPDQAGQHPEAGGPAEWGRA